MSAPTLYTEREKVLAMREAAANARCTALFVAEVGDHIGFLADKACDACLKKAAQRYPLPKTPRPRVVRDRVGLGADDPAFAAREWRVVDGQIQTSCGDGVWHCLDNGSAHAATWGPNAGRGLAFTPARIRMLADLLDHPTELSDDE